MPLSCFLHHSSSSLLSGVGVRGIKEASFIRWNENMHGYHQKEAKLFKLLIGILKALTSGKFLVL